MPRRYDKDLSFSRVMALRFSMTGGKKRKRKPRKGEGGELVPVEPDKPKSLSGGAAAALEFDD